jgi:prepilin-type N-terminal cleavage/methylation domain-containing protein/prepilin-type processing-associated H-X9-DG protein
MTIPLPRTRSRVAGFTLMEILVVVAIILVLAAIAFPVFTTVQQRSHKGVAVNTMRQLAAASAAYTSQNDGELPREDAKGTDDWKAAADPENAKAWYNALLKIMGSRTVGDYAIAPRDFYSKENILYLPGATYPEGDKKLVMPLFAIAINTKLQRKDPVSGKKSPAMLSNIPKASKTVLFLEQGLPGEKKAHPTQSKYDGSCKGSARSFAARYGETGALCFVDGHVEFWKAEDLLTETGKFPFPPEGVIWTRNEEEDANK